jgi:K+-sensing histidine kinase KdpD
MIMEAERRSISGQDVHAPYDDTDKNHEAIGVPSENVAEMWFDLLAGLSHEFRTPLSSIKGYATTLLREDVLWDATTQKQFLEIIVEEADHLEILITKLLNSTTFSWKGSLELNKERVFLPQTAKKVINDPAYHTKNHIFSSLFPGDFPPVSADPLLIEQVLRNLVENAVKYSNEHTLVVVKGEVMSGEIIVSVADQGIGISEEHLNRLFEKFFRVAKGKKSKGLGLGLPMARKIITSHGGRIWATSKPNEGATFYFSLPVDKAKPNSRQEVPSGDEKKPNLSGGRRASPCAFVKGKPSGKRL